MFRFKALQYEEPGKLGGISYFQSIIQLILDVAVLGVNFTYLQFLGIAIIVGVNSIKFGYWIKKVTKKKK